MEYKCSVCGENIGQELLVFIDHTDQHIINVIKTKHPEWAEDDGMCKKCVDYYRKQIKGTHHG